MIVSVLSIPTPRKAIEDLRANRRFWLRGQKQVFSCLHTLPTASAYAMLLVGLAWMVGAPRLLQPPTLFGTAAGPLPSRMHLWQGS